MNVARAPKAAPSIPTSSMGDIVFLLLVFFMTTTIFKHENGLEISLPRAEASKKQKTEQLAHVWVDQKSRISVNDKLIFMPDIQGVMKQRLEGNPLMIVSFKADNRVKYEVMNSIMEELKQINAVRVVFSSEMESSGRRR
jgi:biopolymer transport protein ExbD